MKLLLDENQSRAATLKLLLDNRPMIEAALLQRDQACVELSAPD